MSFIRKYKKDGKTYLAEVKSVREDGKVTQKFIRYVGKEVDGETIITTSTKDLEVNEVKLQGPLLALNAIAKKINLPFILGKHSEEILSLVYAHCLEYRSLKNMPDWFKRTDLNHILNLDELTQAKLVSALDSLTEDKINDLQREIFKKTKGVYKLDSKGAVFDVTNTYLYGNKCQIAKLGKSKEGKHSKPLVQIGLAITQEEGVPIFHNTFEGNIHDSKILNSQIDLFSKYSLKAGGVFVCDRGLSSKQNINEIRGLGWHCLCGLPLRTKEKEILKKFLKADSLTQIKNRVKLNSAKIYVEKIPYSLGRVKGQLYICYNEERKIQIRESRYDEIEQAKLNLSKGLNIKKGLEKYLTPKGRIRLNTLEEAQKYDGYFCLFSTKNFTPRQAVKLYFEKDLVEKAFKTIKGVTNLRPIRHWLYNRVRAHVFICYLSYLLLSLLRIHTKNLGLTPDKALHELKTVYKIYLRNPKKKLNFEKTVTLNRLQEKILKSIDKKLLTECSE